MYVTFDGMNVMKNEQVEFSSHSDTSTIVVQYLQPNISELFIYEAIKTHAMKRSAQKIETSYTLLTINNKNGFIV
jgi:hypothetical protein